MYWGNPCIKSGLNRKKGEKDHENYLQWKRHLRNSAGQRYDCNNVLNERVPVQRYYQRLWWCHGSVLQWWRQSDDLQARNQHHQAYQVKGLLPAPVYWGCVFLKDYKIIKLFRVTEDLYKSKSLVIFFMLFHTIKYIYKQKEGWTRWNQKEKFLHMEF